MILDFETGSDVIDLRGIDAMLGRDGDQAFVFKGERSNKNAGDLTIKTYTSINGAENALGIDIDGLDGPGADVPVTVIFGNTDGGAADFGIVLVGVTNLTAIDFML